CAPHMRILLIALGGAIGAVLRYAVGGWAQRVSSAGAFPAGTLVVNLTGCVAIGVISELAESRGVVSPEVRTFLVVGILGAYTTFSAFANESLNLVRDGVIWIAWVNIMASVLAGLFAVWGGRALAHAIWR